MKIGIVLEGGGMRGMYTCGLLDTFLENNIKVNGVIGASAGVLFGVNYVSNQKGRAIRYNKRFAKDSRYMGIKSLLITGNIINKDFAFYTVPQELDLFDDETFKKSDIDFYATVTNVETGKAEYMKLNSVFEDMEILRATSAMPLVSKMVMLEENKYYLDGAIADSIPVEKMQELGYDKIIVILTRPIEYRKKLECKTLMQLAYRKYPNLLNAILHRHEIYNNQVEQIIELEKQNKIVVIRPTRVIKVSRTEKDIKVLQEMYELGIKDAKSKLNELKQFIGL